jgi:hypothetical protein
MTRSFLGPALAASVVMVSCTAILGGVPTSGGSGGGAGDGTSSSAATRGAGGAAGGTSSPSGGSGGVSPGSGGNGGNGGSGACVSKGAPCGPSAKCCSGLICGAGSTCDGASPAASTGGPACVVCNDALTDPSQMSALCSVSKLKFDALKQCGCNSCPQACAQACSGGGLTQACAACAISSCQPFVNACTSDADCNKCGEALLIGDKATQDVCHGMSSTLFSAWVDCVCFQDSGCDSCSTYCATGVVTTACQMCLEAQSSHCKMAFDQCSADH